MNPAAARRVSFEAAVLVLAACGSPAPPPESEWPIHGAVAVVASGSNDSAVIDRLGAWRRSDPDCVADAYGGIAIGSGSETVLASYSQGVVVLGSGGALRASTPGLPCVGSEDNLDAVEIVRTLDGDTRIAVVTTSGGRVDNMTSLALFGRDRSATLELLFSGDLRHVQGDETAVGDVTLIPGGLLYTRPGGPTSLWRLDRAAHRYVRWIDRPRVRTYDERPRLVD